MGTAGGGARLVPPNPWGCLSQLFPEKIWFVWWGRGQQRFQPCLVGSLPHGSASLEADALAGGNTRGFRLLPLLQNRVFTALYLNQTAFMRRGRSPVTPMVSTWCLHPAIAQATSGDI